jgi:hypothetical protein
MVGEPLKRGRPYVRTDPAGSAKSQPNVGSERDLDLVETSVRVWHLEPANLDTSRWPRFRGRSRMAEMLPVLISGGITIAGWYATYAYTKRREDRTRRLDIALKLKARQIEELYGPLMSLVEQVFMVWRVRQRLIKEGGYTDDQRQRIREFFWKEYFTPLHDQISALLRTKAYLLEGGKMPDSFTRYIEHATQEACQHRLWGELSIDTSAVKGRKWPNEFDDDVKASFTRLMSEYQSGVERLGMVTSAKHHEASMNILSSAS